MGKSNDKWLTAVMLLGVILLRAYSVGAQQLPTSQIATVVEIKPVEIRMANRTSYPEHITFAPLNPANVIHKLLEVELKMRESLNQHSFKRDVLLETIGPSGEVTGQYIRQSELILDDEGNRIERVFHHPRSSLKGIKISKEDVQDLSGSQLLGLDYRESAKYQFIYTGIETVNGHHWLAVDIKPAQMPDPHRMRNRYFVGRVWLDPHTYQIVQIRGKTEPQGKQRFPLFETYRETPATSYLFPSRTYGDDVLYFRDRAVRLRVKVRYYDYKRFGSTLKITEVDEP